MNVNVTDHFTNFIRCMLPITNVIALDNLLIDKHDNSDVDGDERRRTTTYDDVRRRTTRMMALFFDFWSTVANKTKSS